MIYEVKKLDYYIKSHAILDGVSFDIGAGEFVAIIGPNGAGKSTLLKHLTKILRPPPGCIKLYEKDILDYKQREVAAKVGYVPQSAPVYLPFTALQFVLMGRYPHLNPLLRPGRKETRIAMGYLEKVGMAAFADRQMDMVSGGERQKIFIASALAQEPCVILLDEPTTYLDPMHQSDVQDILSTRNREDGMAVIAVTHDINFASRFCSRVIAIKEGRVVYDGEVKSIMNEEKLEGIYGAEFEVFTAGKSGTAFAFPQRNHD